MIKIIKIIKKKWLKNPPVDDSFLFFFSYISDVQQWKGSHRIIERERERESEWVG